MMVSIIVPYNEDRGFLRKCLESLYAQTVPVKIIEVYGQRSAACNVNIGLWQVTTEYFKVVGEDDWLPPRSIEDLTEGIGDAPWVVANAINVFGRDQVVYKPDTLDFAANVKLNRIHNGGTMYRTEIIKEIGGLDETLWTAEEYDMHLKLMSLGHLPKYLDKEVYYYRQHGGQKYKKLNDENRKKRANEIARIQSLYSNKV